MEILNLGFLNNIEAIWLVLGIITVVSILGFNGAPLFAWLLFAAFLMAGFSSPLWLWIVLALVAVLLLVPPVRRTILSSGVMKFMKAMNFLPVISQTERTAIEAGTVWIEGELFSGKPDFKRMMSEGYPGLSADEQAFIDGPVEKLCAMADDWDIYKHKEFDQKIWDYIKQEKFFGLIIPREYGGLGFSSSANSAIVLKISTRSGPLGTTVMVPNSLGPAELLIHYGTDGQKDYYLPRLARGEEIPCFALTEPEAGSDAGAITSNGVLFKGEDGNLFIKLNWNKRYITLAAISTVLGMAFRLFDPDNLLGKETDLGITCGLIPSNTPGVDISRRHDPLGVPFFNCPTTGTDVIVPIDIIIGGKEGVGKGWKMLMESLAAGRGISLPAVGCGGGKYVTRVTGAYAKVRQQFGLPIGKFEGIEEPLARIAGFSYIMEASRKYTNGALDAGAKPAVVTAIAKYNFTELSRKIINDGMDIMGGAGISRGPRNLLAHGYISSPIAITVEGANILTRTLMIFGQGAIRCHPYAYKEIDALSKDDLKAFDAVFWKHIGHVVRNKFRAFLLSISRGYLAFPGIGGPASRYYRKMAWTSASFAFLADLAMSTYGGRLKAKGKLTGRFADILSWMYLGSAVLRRFEAEGRPKDQLPLLHWSMQHCFAQCQSAFNGILDNFDIPVIGAVFRGPVAFWSRLNPIGTKPSDRLGHIIAQFIQEQGSLRDALTEGIYISQDKEEALGRLENAFLLVTQSDPIYKKMRIAIKERKLPKSKPSLLIESALEKGIITDEEAILLRRTEDARYDVLTVDSFTLEEYKQNAANKDNPEMRAME
ncbi:MAG: acyl-CoA dehydrogenase [Balneolales bacterium]